MSHSVFQKSVVFFFSLKKKVLLVKCLEVELVSVAR